MPFTSGTYSLPSGNPVVTGTTISSTTTNTTNSDIATALSTCVLKDGSQTITANLPMASHKLTGLSAGTTAGDSVEYGGSPSFTNLAYTGTLTGSTGILNIGSGQIYKAASGNVGIGTSSPSSRFEVANNATNAEVRISSTQNVYSSLYLNTLSLDRAQLRAEAANPGAGSGTGSGILSFWTAGNPTMIERMRIDASGNVGIGNTNPLTKLDVYGAQVLDRGVILAIDSTAQAAGTGAGLVLGGFYSATQTSSGVQIKASKTNGTAGDYGFDMSFLTLQNSTSNLTERMRISSTGIVTMSAYGAGAATFSAAGVISSVSDETWKIKDGVPVDADSMLKNLEPGYWYYNEEKAPIFGTDRQLGFYAQNVNAAIGPEAAPAPEEGKPWGYYDRSVLAVTVLSLQKALTTIETLTARLTALDAK